MLKRLAMATLNISLPDQLREWVKTQISTGQYSSASDYLRDLIRQDVRAHQGDTWLNNHIQERLETADDSYVQSSADDVKTRMRLKIGKSN